MKGEMSSGSNSGNAGLGFLSKIDLYGYVPELLYKGATSHNTRYGGLVSIVAALGYVAVISFTVWRYFQREAPATNVETKFVPDPPGFTWDRDKFPFAFGIQDGTASHFIDDQIYTVDAVYNLKTTTFVDGKEGMSFDSISIPLIRCSEANLDPAYFNNIPFKDLYCLKEFINPLKGFQITGRWESNTFGYLNFDFKKCNASATTCKSDTPIAEKLKNAYFAVYFIDRVLKASDFDTPWQVIPRSQYMSTSIAYTKYLSYYLQENTVASDSSLIGYLQPALQSFVSVGTQYSDISNFALDSTSLPGIFLNFVVRMSTSQVDITRKYKNIYDYLAEFGGMSQVVGILALVMTFRMRKLNLIMDLARNTIDKEDFYQKLIAEYVVENDQKDGQERGYGFRNAPKHTKATPAPIFAAKAEKAPRAKPTSSAPKDPKDKKHGVYSVVGHPTPHAPTGPTGYSPQPARPGPVSRTSPTHPAGSPDTKTATHTKAPQSTPKFGQSSHLAGDKDQFYVKNSPSRRPPHPEDTDVVADEGHDRQAVRNTSRHTENDLLKKSLQTSSKIGVSRTELGLASAISVGRRDASVQVVEMRDVQIDAPDWPFGPVDGDVYSQHASQHPSQHTHYHSHQTPQHQVEEEAESTDVEAGNRELVGPMEEFHYEEHRRYEGLKKAMGRIRGGKVFLKGFMPCFTKNSKITAVTEAVEKRVYANFDFLKIIETVEDFEKLKRMMLTPEQQILFDLIPSQRLKYDENERQFTLLRQSMTLKVKGSEYRAKKAEVFKAFNTVKDVRTKSELDRNLVRSLGFLMNTNQDSLGLEMREDRQDSEGSKPQYA